MNTSEQPNCDVNWFINFFTGIPDDQWCQDTVGEANGGRRCAIGHCRFGIDGGIVDETGYGPTERALARLLSTFAWDASTSTLENLTIITNINDGKNIAFPQSTPRARILAALREIQAKQEAAKPKVAVVVHECCHLFIADCCVYCGHVNQQPKEQLCERAQY